MSIQILKFQQYKHIFTCPAYQTTFTKLEISTNLYAERAPKVLLALVC